MFRRNEPVLVNRDHYQRPAPIPELRLRELTPNLSDMQKRDSDDSGSNSSTTKQTSNGSSTTPIVIGVIVPVVIIAIILLVIWRRRQKITKQEEMNEHMKYKSLDFGVDESQMREKKGRRTKPDLTIQDIKGSLRKDRGLSLDLDASNPYLLPPEVHSSRESLHSLSRSINTGDDKYRATTFIPDDGSLRSPSSLRSHGDGASVFSASTRHRTGTMETDSRTDILPRIPAKRDESEAASIRKPLPVAEKPDQGLLLPNAPFDRNSTLSTASKDGNVAALRASNNYLGQYISGGQKNAAPKKEEQPGLMVHEMEVQPTPPADNSPREPPKALVHHEVTLSKRQSIFQGHGIAELADNDYSSRRSSNQDPKLPQIHTTSYEMDASPRQQFPQRKKSLHKPDHSKGRRESGSQLPSVPETRTQSHNAHDDAADDYYDEEGFDDYANYVDYTYRGSMVGVRPLPPDDPSENPEQRANRIRSFYKEYFEEGANPQKNRTSYYDGSEQYDDFDYGYYEQSQAHSRGPSIRSDGRHRAYSQGMRPNYPPGPRAYSSMSGRMGPHSRQGQPKKKLPPPKPLMVLPTPHMLKDDDFLPNAIDFAPPQVFRNQRSGTPDSLRGGLRPYSPSVKPHNPLTSSFDDLAVIPSPHSLRKSGTFTMLDFAPPRRFKENGEAMSETGSVHSNRSNLSKVQLASIRNGAYRVSRIPKDVAGTRDDMATALKPKWDMRGDGMGAGR